MKKLFFSIVLIISVAFAEAPEEKKFNIQSERLNNLSMPLFKGEKEENTLENSIKNCSFRVGIWARESEYEYCKCLFEIKDEVTCKAKFDEEQKEERLDSKKCLERSRTHHEYEYDFESYCNCQSDYYVRSGYYNNTSKIQENPEDIANKCREEKIFYVD